MSSLNQVLGRVSKLRREINNMSKDDLDFAVKANEIVAATNKIQQMKPSIIVAGDLLSKAFERLEKAIWQLRVSVHAAAAANRYCNPVHWKSHNTYKRILKGLDRNRGRKAAKLKEVAHA